MMKKMITGISLFMTAALMTLQLSAQKKVSELMLVYDYSVKSEGNSGTVSATATNTIYVKGNLSRTEWKSNLFSSVTIYDSKAGTAIQLKEVSGQKLLIRMNAENIEERDSRFAGLIFANTAETKTIAGYRCVKATATTKDGFTLAVYYTKELVTENRDYDPMFRNSDGLPPWHELANGKIKITNLLSAINLNPVPASKI